jgi:hypothetical protein
LGLGDGGVGGCAAFSAFPPNILKRKKKAATTTATGSKDMTICEETAGILEAL